MYEVPGRVSIVAPSMATRQHYHENLYRCFEAQDYPGQGQLDLRVHVL